VTDFRLPRAAVYDALRDVQPPELREWLYLHLEWSIGNWTSCRDAASVRIHWGRQYLAAILENDQASTHELEVLGGDWGELTASGELHR
jgi:hypothetical protein